MVKPLIEGLKLGRRRVSVDRNRRIQEACYLVLDTELTGLDERTDSIVSIGAVKMTGGRIELGSTFYRLANPEKDLTAESVVIHQITPSEVSQQPDIRSVMSEFSEFCGDAIIVGYCVAIDMEFLNREMKRWFGHAIDNPVIDVYPIFEWAVRRENFRVTLPAQQGLYDIARNFGISVNGAHNAMIDAFITAQVFQRLLPILGDSGIENLGDLLKLSQRIRGGDRHSIARGLSNF